MMAVDSKQGGSSVPATGTPSAGTPSAAQTLAGMPAVAANGSIKASGKRKRPSSLLAQATSLPSVESSLDDFIARANETLGDASFETARIAEKELKQEDEKRKEVDALRWKATEQQMRESQAREESLRRQLDGLQGKLAEAEARAAVASTGGSQDGVIADLKYRLTSLEDAKRSAEDRSAQLAQELVIAKASQASAPAAQDSLSMVDTDELEQRARLAEAKAAKALAAAKAAAAGLTVNPADLAAIESGLVVPVETKKGTNWGLVFVALLVGGAIAAAAVFVVLNNNKDSAKPAAAAAPAVEQAPAQAAAPTPAPAAPSKPTVTPIEETDSAAAAAQPAQPAAQPAPEAKAAAPEVKAEPKAAAPEVKAEPKAEEKAAAAEPAPAKVEKKAAPTPKKASAPTKKAATSKASKPDGGLADPFGGGGETPAPKKTKPAKKAKASGGGDTGIVDPF